MSTSDLSNFLCKQSLFHLNDGHLLIQPHGNKNGLSNHFFFVLAWINVLHMAWLSDKQNAWHIHAHMEQLKNKTCIRICWYFISEVQQSKEVATYCCKQVKMLRNYTCTMRFIVSDMKWICKAISPDSYVVQHIGKEKKQLEEEKNAKDLLFWLIPNTRRKEYMMTSVKDITFLEMPWRWQKMSTICSHNIYTIIKTCPQGLTVSRSASKMTQRQPQCHTV